MKKLTSSLFVMIASLLSAKAFAFNFKVTEAEFNSWDRMCQGMYLSTTVGQKSEFSGMMPADEVKKIRDYASEIKGGPWHYCSGLIWYRRSQFEGDVEEKKIHLEKALDQYKYTMRGVLKSDPWYAEMLVNKGIVLRDLENYDDALQAMNEALERFPDYTPAYLAMSLVYRKKDDLANAIKTLKKAPEDFQQSSPALNYYLGLFYLAEEDYAQAQHYSDIAYELGYPLPWLKQQLKKLNASQN